MAEHEQQGESHGGEDHGEHKKGHGGGHAHGGGGHEEHAGAPEWLISFADNVALLMGFFVILLAMQLAKKVGGGADGASPAEAAAAEADLVLGIREAFRNPVSIDSKDPKDAALVKRLRQKLQKGDGQDDGVKGEKQSVQAPRPTGYANIAATIAFDAGSSTVPMTSRSVLVDAAGRLRGQRFVVDIRGHVSAMEAAAGIDSAMRLSYHRAMAVGILLVENGVKWNQLRLSAAADNDRATALAFDPAAHRSNQRVELIVTNDEIPGDPHVKEWDHKSTEPAGGE